MNGASWVVDKCNSAGKIDFAQKLANHMIEQRSLGLFTTSNNMALFQLGDVLSISDIGQSDQQISDVADHVRAMLPPNELGEIYSREGSDAVAIGDGLWAISQWRYPNVDSVFWSDTLRLRTSSFANQLSLAPDKLKDISWYAKQYQRNPQISDLSFRQIQFVRLLGAISLIFDLDKFQLDWKHFVNFGRLASEPVIQHPTNYEIVQRHQMQFWTGLRALSQKAATPMCADVEKITNTLDLWRGNQQYAVTNGHLSSFRHSVMIDWLERCKIAGKLVNDGSEIRWFRG